ncbi:hypothetical protein JCM14722_09470 [Pseudodesulfovibrio portus]|uniref:Transposase n=1 Tax=Pseudodesulfovibrio portus TaxID=231439 RepID=A0ABM8APT7_9BACT|nr:hypothetical protein JCM14722_09470 [Pseudodesulfovibrio portus]
MPEQKMSNLMANDKGKLFGIKELYNPRADSYETFLRIVAYAIGLNLSRRIDPSMDILLRQPQEITCVRKYYGKFRS